VTWVTSWTLTCCNIAIDAVVSPAPLCVAQKPIAACDGKQLKLNDQGRAVFSAHKQMYVGYLENSDLWGASSTYELTESDRTMVRQEPLGLRRHERRELGWYKSPAGELIICKVWNVALFLAQLWLHFHWL
jgi:hypothetical protein